MNATTFNKHLEYMQKATVDTLKAKAAEYATEEDRLHNFKIAGPLQSRTPIGALGGFMAKHTISLYDMIIGTDKGTIFPLNMWEEKIKDHINYLFLLWAAVNEQDETEEALIIALDALKEKAKAQQETAEANQKDATPEPQPIINPKFEEILDSVDEGLKDKKEEPADEGLGLIEENKLRRRAQAALSNWCQKHGSANLRPVVRATGNRLTERTLREMLANTSYGSTKYWTALDNAMKRLALKEIEEMPE